MDGNGEGCPLTIKLATTRHFSTSLVLDNTVLQLHVTIQSSPFHVAPAAVIANMRPLQRMGLQALRFRLQPINSVLCRKLLEWNPAWVQAFVRCEALHEHHATSPTFVNMLSCKRNKRNKHTITLHSNIFTHSLDSIYVDINYDQNHHTK